MLTPLELMSFLIADLALRTAQLPEAERARVLQRLQRGPADRRRRGDVSGTP